MSRFRRMLLNQKNQNVVYDAVITKSGGNITASNKSVSFGYANERYFTPEMGKTYRFEGYVDIEIADGDDTTLRCMPLSSPGFGYRVLQYATRYEQISPTVRRFTIVLNQEQQPVMDNTQFLFYVRCDYCTINVTSHVVITEV